MYNRKIKTQYTMYDIKKVQKAVELELKILNNKEASYKFSSKEFSQRKSIFIYFTKEFKKYLPGLTIKRMKEIYEENENLKRERTKRKPEFHCRLYPLKKEVYNRIAEKAWNRKGRPKFGKKIISDVIWGSGKISTNGKFGWDLVIYNRCLGCIISINKDNGKTSLQIVCPD